MGLKRRFIKDSGYFAEDDFLDAMDNMDSDLAIKIALYIEENVTDIPPNKLTTYVLGGVVNHENHAYTFILEILNEGDGLVTLTDFDFIDMNEYLDLINLNQIIKK